MAWLYFHNPRCSKSREALRLLRERGVEPEIVEYLQTPPTGARLREILALLGHGPRQLLRKGEAAYRELGLADEQLDDEALIAAMVAQPILIERPILIGPDRAVVGRPPERVLELIDA